MLVKNVIEKVLELTEEYDLIASMNAGDVLVDEQALYVSGLVNCLNFVRNEIATEYIPNVKVQNIITNNGRIDFSQLEGDVIEILSVKDSFGNSLKFDAFSDFILVEASSVQVRYNASPENLGLEDEFYSTIPDRVYAYGILREYFYIQSLYEDANVWENRFKNSLEALARKKNETVILRRRWL